MQRLHVLGTTKALCGHTHVWDAAEKTETPSAGATRGRCRRGRCGRVPCQELCEEAGCRDLGDARIVVRCAMGHSCGSWVLLKKVGHCPSSKQATINKSTSALHSPRLHKVFKHKGVVESCWTAVYKPPCYSLNISSQRSRVVAPSLV